MASFALITPQDRQVPPSREAASPFRTSGRLAPISLRQLASSLSPAAWPSLRAGRRGRSGAGPARASLPSSFSSGSGLLGTGWRSEGQE